MNTFFVSPVIPFYYYILIQQEKNNSSIRWTTQEQQVLNNINMLFDYTLVIDYSTRQIIRDILSKIQRAKPNYRFNVDDLIFATNKTYKFHTNYNYIYYKLFRKRNYHQIINPFDIKRLDATIGIADTGPTKISLSIFDTLQTDIEKREYIQNKITLDSSSEIKRNILSRSTVNGSINIISKILSNKYLLSNMLKDQAFIPIQVAFNRTSDDYTLNNAITQLKRKISSDKFVIKPVEGTLADGVGIFPLSSLTVNFIKSWISNLSNNKYAIDNSYYEWILSEYIESFAWKLKGQNQASINLPNIVATVPRFRFNFKDTTGRRSIFRFYILFNIINNEFTSYLYKDAWAMINDKQLGIDDNLSTKEDESFNMELYFDLLSIKYNLPSIQRIVQNSAQNTQERLIEAAYIGGFYEFSRLVNETNYPFGPQAWKEKIMPQMYHIVNAIANQLKKYMSCMNKYTISGNKGCFTFFAVDAIINPDQKVYVLEANTQPYIGFDNEWKRFPNIFKHVLNIETVLNDILTLTVDDINGGYTRSRNRLENFLVTQIDTFKTHRRTYVPLTSGLSNPSTSTSMVYQELYNILNTNNFKSFPYPKYINKNVLANSPGFRGTSKMVKYLMNNLDNIKLKEYLNIIKQLYPYDAKMKLLNRISTLGFYLGNKTVLTKLLQKNVPNWASIIPYTITIDTRRETQQSIMSKLNDSQFENKILIAKPATGQQGKGIVISENKNYLMQKMWNSTESEYTISIYLNNPYLVKLNKVGVSGIRFDDTYGRKCHLRTYVLVYKTDNKLRIYLYKKSLIFCAAKEYNSCTANTEFCNLTNLYYGSLYYKDVLNVDPNDAYKDLSVLTSDIVQGNQYYNLMEKLRYIIKTVILATKDKLVCLNEQNNCYQYIAYDFHLENENGVPVPWLLEVNATPGLKAPDYQWKEFGGVKNFLESILNITIGTKISGNNKQLFEYIPHLKKKYLSNLPFDANNSCMNYSYKELKTALSELQISGRSKLTTKQQMCDKLSSVEKI